MANLSFKSRPAPAASTRMDPLSPTPCCREETIGRRALLLLPSFPFLFSLSPPSSLPRQEQAAMEVHWRSRMQAAAVCLVAGLLPPSSLSPLPGSMSPRPSSRPSPEPRHPVARQNPTRPMRRRVLLTSTSSVPCFPASMETDALTVTGPASPRFCSSHLFTERPKAHGEARSSAPLFFPFPLSALPLFRPRTFFT